MNTVCIDSKRATGGDEPPAPQASAKAQVKRINQHERASIYNRVTAHGATVVSIARGQGLSIQQVVDLLLEQSAIERGEACKRAFTSGRIAGMSFPLKRAA